MANSWMQGMEELSGKEGESILLSSRVTGNSIEPVIETFFISFLVSLLYNSSSSLLSLLSRWCSMFLFNSVLPHPKEHVLLSPRFFFCQTTAQISDFSLTVAAKWRRSHTPDFFFFAFNSAFVFVSLLTLSICKFCSSKFHSSMFVCSLSKTSCERILFNSIKFSKQIQQR